MVVQMRHPASDLYRAALNDANLLRVAISWAAAVLAATVAGAGISGLMVATLACVIHESGRYFASLACRLDPKFVASDLVFANFGPMLWTFAWACVAATVWLASGSSWFEWTAFALGAALAASVLPWRAGEARNESARIQDLLDGAESTRRHRLAETYLMYLEALRCDDGPAAGDHLRHMLEFCPDGGIPPAVALEIAYYQASYRNKPESSRSWIHHAATTGTVPLLLLHRAVAATHLAEGDPHGAIPHARLVLHLAPSDEYKELAELERELARGIELGAAVLLDLQSHQNKWLMAS